MKKGEFYFNRYTSCGDLVDVMVKAFSEAKKITANNKIVNWPEEPLPSGLTVVNFDAGPIVVYFDDGSLLQVVDVPSPLSKNVKITWGTYTDRAAMD
jgi:hypothetical protein